MFDITMQPVVAQKQRRVVFFEVHPRLDPARLGLEAGLSSEDVVHAIENCRLGYVFDLAVVKKALAAIQRFQVQNETALHVSINISTQTLSTRSFATDLFEPAQNSRVSPHQIQLEITETALVASLSQNSVVQEITSKGFPVVVEDFISDHAGFAILSNENIKSIKVNSSTVLRLENSAVARRFLSGLQALTESVGKHLIIDGVEDREQLDIFMDLGCDTLQGSNIGHPMVPEDASLFTARVEVKCPPCPAPGR